MSWRTRGESSVGSGFQDVKLSSLKGIKSLLDSLLWKGVIRVNLLRRLNGMRSWLQVGNTEQDVSVRMTSKNRCDPRGNKAVHGARKEQYNTIRTYTEAHIEVPSGDPTDWQDYYTGAAYPVVDGTILVRFAPLEVKVLLESK